MCILIHKPAGATVPTDLLHAAARFNADGFGLMGFDADDRVLVERYPSVDVEHIATRLAGLRQAELAIHLRRRTYGPASFCNAHPFDAGDGVYLMHNGQLHLPVQDPSHSDTRHFVLHVLRPLVRAHPGLIESDAFITLLNTLLGPDNRMALLDTRRKRLHIINRAAGIDHGRLWISSARWLDRSLFALPGHAPPLPALVGWG